MVFLSALWAIMNWATDLLLQRTGHKVMHCESHFDTEDGPIHGHGLANLHPYGSSETAFAPVSQEFYPHHDKGMQVDVTNFNMLKS